MKRSPMRRRRSSTGPSPEVREIVIARSRGLCEACLVLLFYVEIHHRRPRAMGGSRDPETNAATNLLALCPECHRKAETNRAWALDHGLLVLQGEDPASIPVLPTYPHARPFWLLPDGSLTPEPPTKENDR